MQIYTGLAAAPGLAQGVIKWFGEAGRVPVEKGTPEQELNRFRQAREDCIRRQAELYDRALEQAGEDAAAIFDLHGMLLQEDLEEFVLPHIRAGESAADAARHGMEELGALFRDLDDEYMSQRSEDMIELGRELAARLEGRGDMPVLTSPAILAAEELFPGQAVSLPRELLRGVVLRRGGAQSHMAILARSMGIPLLVCPQASQDWDGRTALMDGSAGRLMLDPDSGAQEKHAQRKEQAEQNRLLQENYRGQPTQTAAGRPVRLLANIGGEQDLPMLRTSDAEGVGLFRSEFLYLDREDWPEEETQYRAYLAAAEALPGRRITIRTFDLGADKTAPYMKVQPCSNPALGSRGLRFGLQRPELLRCQLRAILRAAARAPMAVMFPLVCTPEELDRALALMEECRRDLLAAGVPAGEPMPGCMVETPAAVMHAGELAERCRFLSLGTNDLFQYTFAADRESSALQSLYNPRDPALLRMIGMTVQAAHAVGCTVNVCGQLAADTDCTEALLALGVDGLSVPPAQVLAMRRHIRSIAL